MNLKNPFVQGALLVIAAVVLALISNAVAGRERRLVLAGYYPDALKVPKHTPEPASRTAPAPSLPAPAATMTSPAPGAPALPVPSATVERPAGTATATPPKRATTTSPPAAPAAEPAAATTADNSDPLKRFPPHPDKPYVEISGDDAAWLRSKGALVIDARRTSIYEQGHIAGARSMPVWESDIDKRVNDLFSERSDPQQQLQPIVIYCSGGDCEDSHMLAQRLWGIQFNNIYVYKDGFPDWQKRGGPIDSGSNP